MPLDNRGWMQFLTFPLNHREVFLSPMGSNTLEWLKTPAIQSEKEETRSDGSAEEQGSSEPTRSETTPSVTEREQSESWKKYH